MKKSKKSMEKDDKRHNGKIWVDKKTKPEDRKTGSGVTFTGAYVDKWKR